MMQAFIEQTTALYASKEQSFVGLVKAAGLSPALDFQMRDLRDLPLAGEDVEGVDFTGSRLEGSGIEEAVNLDKAILIDATFKAGSPLVITAFSQKMRGLEFIEAAKLLVGFLKDNPKATLPLLETLFSLMDNDLRGDIWFYKSKGEFKGLDKAQKYLVCFVILNELKDFLCENEKVFQDLLKVLDEVNQNLFLKDGAIAISNAIGEKFTPEFKLKELFLLQEKTIGDLPDLFARTRETPIYDDCVQALYVVFGKRGLRAIRAHASHDDEINSYVLNEYLVLKTGGNYKTLTQLELEEIDGFFKEQVKNNEKNDAVLGNYANLLRRLNRYDEAEVYYKKALEIEPDDAIYNGNYAFLLTLQNRYVEAEVYYKKALEVDPDDAIYNGNYAYLLFLQGRKPEALPYLAKSNENKPPLEQQTANAYYLFAFVDFEALSPLKKLLIEGNRSLGFSLDQSLERAEKDNHPHLDLLKALIEVITRDAPIETLEAFAKWHETVV